MGKSLLAFPFFLRQSCTTIGWPRFEQQFVLLPLCEDIVRKTYWGSIKCQLLQLYQWNWTEKPDLEKNLFTLQIWCTPGRGEGTKGTLRQT